VVILHSDTELSDILEKLQSKGLNDLVGAMLLRSAAVCRTLGRWLWAA
jgi:hypothetical protein